MRILIAGPDKIFSIEKFYAKYLRDLDLEVVHFPAQTLFSDYYEHAAFNKLVFKLGLSGIYRRINQRLKMEIEQTRPDVVWVFKGMEIFPETLEWVRKRGIFLLNYNPDNPFIFSGRGSGNSNITQSLGLYDFHFTYNLEVKKQLEDRFQTQVEWLPFGFDIPTELYAMCADEKEEIRACFVGNPDKERATLMNYLLDNGVKIDLFGNSWARVVSNKNARIHQPVYEMQLYKVLRKYRVQLNPLRPHNRQSHCMRTFEVPAIGGIMLAEDTSEHRIFFKENEEAFFYCDFEDCLTKVKRLLMMRSEDAKQIRVNARARCCLDGYDYRSRSQFVKSVLEIKLK